MYYPHHLILNSVRVSSRGSCMGSWSGVCEYHLVAVPGCRAAPGAGCYGITLFWK